jgi:hypothetical protein
LSSSNHKFMYIYTTNILGYCHVKLWVNIKLWGNILIFTDNKVILLLLYAWRTRHDYRRTILIGFPIP